MKDRYVEQHLEDKSIAFQTLKRACTEKKGRGHANTWRKLKSAILRRAKASIFAVALHECGDGPNQSKWKDAVAAVRTAGGDNLVNGLNRYAKDHRRRTDKAGVFQTGIFVPLSGMLRFRDYAKKLWVENCIAKVKASYPPELFRLWFLYWVLPARLRDEQLNMNGRVVTLKHHQQAVGEIAGISANSRAAEPPLSKLARRDADALIEEGHNAIRRPGDEQPEPAVGKRPPSNDAIVCYRAHFVTGMKQTQLAKRMTAELKRPITQGQVSK